MRYRVRDVEHLRDCMSKSQRIVPHSVRSLAKLVGRSPSGIGYLLTGERPVVDESVALGVAAALNRTVGDLFVPEPSQSRDGDGSSE